MKEEDAVEDAAPASESVTEAAPEGESDPFDSPSFTAVQYVNKMFPTGVYGGGVGLDA